MSVDVCVWVVECVGVGGGCGVAVEVGVVLTVVTEGVAECATDCEGAGAAEWEVERVDAEWVAVDVVLASVAD